MHHPPLPPGSCLSLPVAVGTLLRPSELLRPRTNRYLGWRVEPLAGERHPSVPARPQVVQEVDEAALTQATRRCWNLLFLRRRREQRRSFPQWRAGRRIFHFCSATFSKEQFPFPPGSQVHGTTVCDALLPHSRPRPILPVARVRFGGDIPPHAPLAFGEDASERTAFCSIHPYSLSLHHHRYVDCAVGAACTASGGVAQAAQPVSLAQAHNSTRLRDSVHQATSQF